MLIELSYRFCLNYPRRALRSSISILVQKYLNTTPNRNTDTTPFNFLFGTHMKMKDEPELMTMLDNEWAQAFQGDRQKNKTAG